MKHVNFQTSSKRKKKWFDHDCDSLYRNLKSTARTLSKSCNVPSKLQYYFSLSKQYKQLIRMKQQHYKSKLLNSVIELENNDSKSFWKVVNEFKNSDTSVIDQSSNIALMHGFSISMVWWILKVSTSRLFRRVHVRFQLLFMNWRK